jgi:hypothetical protein
MNARRRFIVVTMLASAQVATASFARTQTFSTLITTPLAIEGITSDYVGNLYVPGRTPGPGLPCPVWRVTHPPLSFAQGTAFAPVAPQEQHRASSYQLRA